MDKTVKVSPLLAMKDVDARFHIYTATALGRGMMASPMSSHLYLWGNPPVLIL